MSSIASQLEKLQLQLYCYELPIIFGLGIIGNLTNIITFGTSTLRKNMCSWYFICLSLAHLCVLAVACLPRIIAASTGYDLSSQSLAFCKFRAYATDVSLTLARHFLCLIAIDRWLITSSRLWIRNHSSPRITRRMIAGSFIFWFLFHIHVPIKYGIGRLGCSPPLGTTYELFYSMYNIIISLVPMFIMSIFTILAVRNLRLRLNGRVQPQPLTTGSSSNPVVVSTAFTAQRLRQSRREGQLVRLSIPQVIVFVILNTIRAIFPLYSFLMNSRGGLTADERSLAIFLNGIGNNLLFTYTAITFILYTLASKTFRIACLTRFKKSFSIAKQRLQAMF
ncbi:unnamed protein product [Rotaria sp. Silwood1]|nr:unnamed protein product [Rotaria sp. Silwood1]CAF1180844.1 unnamed protein product [Rotaria sp. Silwood1]CAF3485490.1 unnamed protein product [Rotaria sp. Silwood1]CAF5001207.1 unnamed protein product [Rotaria sp. Silwood1]